MTVRMKNLVLIFGILSANFLFAQMDKFNTNSLTNLGMVQVTLGGAFIVQGTFPASVNERVDQFVTRIFEEAKQNALQLAKDEKTLLEITKKFDRVPFRNIALKRADGTTMKLDLLRFRLDGDFKNNPYIKADDVLIFPIEDTELNFVSVDGAVNYPTSFQFVDGDNLNDAIFFAGGINPAYGNVTSAKIFRLSVDGLTLTAIDAQLNQNFNLKRGDRVQLVGVQPEKNNHKILVLGEVANPGFIPVSKGVQNIFEIIERAGGFTKLSDRKNTRVFSSEIIPFHFFETQFKITDDRTAKLYDEKVIQLLTDLEKYSFSRMSNLTEEDTAYFNLENRLRFLLDAQTIDLSNQKEVRNGALMAGDIIIVPKLNEYVYVYGQVVNPGKIKFSESGDVSYYINHSGGYGEFYDEEIMLIKGSTKEWISITEKTYKIEPGDYIWVPRVEAKSFLTQVKEVSVYLGVVGNLATIILLLIQLTK